MASFVTINTQLNTMSNLLMTYHKAHPFLYPFKFEDNSISTMESTKVAIERNESIHSGHFMVSEIEESEQEKNQKPTTTESDYEREEEARLLSDYEFRTKENTQTYVYGAKTSVQIDGSLTKLFECMSLAYSGKITSPKWKTFKGLKLHIKDKIRLNNIIWRAWHIQYIAGRNPVVCQFSSSVDSKRHKRIEAILLEGKYWKRRVDAVQEEYKKWRMFHRKTGGQQTPFRPSDFDWETCLPRWSNNLSNIDSLFSYEENADFFSSNYNAQNNFGNYYDYNSRDIARSGMGAQFMQPGLQQLQPNVDFMDTFEPIHDVISRIQNHNFTLPTVQEESSFDVNINKEQEDLLSLFVPNNEQTNNAVNDSDLSKPIIESNTYSGQDIFQNSNEMLNMNAKLDTSVLVEQQQQQQPTTMQENFNNMSKLELSTNYNYPNQMMITNNVFGTNQSLHENSTQQLNQPQVKPSMAMDSLYSNKLPFDSSNRQVSTINSSVRTETNNNVFVSRFQSPQVVNAPEVQSQVQNQANVFQTDSNLFYNEQDTSIKTAKNKYPYVPYYPNSAVINNSVNSSGEVTPKVTNQNRLRSKSITMSQVQAHVQAQALAANLAQTQTQSNKASVTIKSLLNKPSLVSTLNKNESSFVSNNTFRVPNQSEIQIRANIERSLSLPIYTQDRQRKSGLSGNQLILQRLQANDSAQSGQFDLAAKNTETNYSFDSGLNNFYQNSLSAATSPMSSHSSSYSNQDSQLLPQFSNNNSQPMRKVSHPGMDYASKISDTQLSLSNLTGNSHTFSSPNIITSLFQVNSSALNQNNVFSPHPSTSSSSSSPIGSLESTKVANNPFGSVSFTLSNVQSQFNTLNKNSRLKLDFGKDQALEQKRNFKKSSNVFDFSSSKEKNLLDGISNAFPSSDLSPTSVQKGSVREISFKHMPSGALSPNTLGSLLPIKSEDRNQYRERRRVCHINAEQKRRCNIKNGFDTLRNLLPSLSSNTNTKISKAAMLQKAADYIRILKSEKYDQQKEYEILKQQVESLNQTISVFQNQLPATGAPITGQRSSQIKEQYVEYVHNRTMQNWKFWIFSIFMESLLDSYCSTVATTNLEEMFKTLNRWFDQNCCLISLRRDVLNSLRFISTSTNILTNPEALPEEALFAVTKSKNSSKDDECHKKFAGR